MLTASCRHLTRRVAGVVLLHCRTVSAVKSKQDEAGIRFFLSSEYDQTSTN